MQSKFHIGLVYWGLTPQQQPGSYQGGEMMMKSVFWWRKPEYPEETTDLWQVTDETFHTKFQINVYLYISAIYIIRYTLHPYKCYNIKRNAIKALLRLIKAISIILSDNFVWC